MAPPIRRASLPVQQTTYDTDVYDVDLYDVRTPQIRRRYDTGQDTQIYTRGNQQVVVHQGPPPKQRRARRHIDTRVVMAFCVIGTLLLIMAGNSLISWWNGWQNNIHYGYPRVSQLDAVVGHNDSPTNPTHFLFLNLHGHIQIIEIPGGDPTKERVFTGPTLMGDGQDLIPVTGQIVNEDGRLDLIVHIQDQQIVYVNDGSTFKEQ